MSTDQRVFLRNELRSARSAMHSDGENYEAVVQAIERVGGYLLPKPEREHTSGLKSYEYVLTELVRAGDVDSTRFATVFDYVREGRNTAVHNGAIARNLSAHCSELALIIEDALMARKKHLVCDFMVSSIVWAEDWQTVSDIRYQMLANSFSFLPVRIDREIKWLRDIAVSRYLRGSGGAISRSRLSETVGTAIKTAELRVSQAKLVSAGSDIASVLNDIDQEPLLVQRSNGEEVVGILTAYDLL